MPIILSALPYEIDALEPHISAETLTVHHGKHQKTYVEKLNKAIEGTPYAAMTLEEIVASSFKDGEVDVFHNAAQAWNHGFYWNCMTANRNAAFSDELNEAITSKFGSVEAMLEDLSTAGEKHFGSGWAWLVIEDGELTVTSTHDAETPAAHGNESIPILTVDVWEHAYYLDWKNERPKYLAAVLKNLINWEFASENFARKSVWAYPAT